MAATLESGIFKCSICEHRFPFRNTLTRHVRAVHRAKITPYFHCGRYFARKDILDRHLRSQHTVDQDTFCERCGKSVRLRSVPAHRASDACRRAGSKADTAVPPQALASISELEPSTPQYADMAVEQPESAALDDHIGLLPAHNGPESHSELSHFDTMVCGEVIPRNTTTAWFGASLYAYQRRAGCTPAPRYLEAIKDPVLFSAWLFVELKPWGPDHCWADDSWLVNPPRTYARPLVQLLEFQDVIYKSIRDALTTGRLFRNPYYADALIMLILFTCQTVGWEAALLHCEPLVWLACQQFHTARGNREAYKSATAIEAFLDVLRRHVQSEYIAPLKKIYAIIQGVMRKAVIDIIDTPMRRVENDEGRMVRSNYKQ